MSTNKNYRLLRNQSQSRSIRSPSRGLSRDLSQSSFRSPLSSPSISPSRELSRSPSRGLSRSPSRGLYRGLSQERSISSSPNNNYLANINNNPSFFDKTNPKSNSLKRFLHLNERHHRRPYPLNGVPFKILYRNIGMDRELPFDAYGTSIPGQAVQSQIPCVDDRNHKMFDQINKLIQYGIHPDNNYDFIVFSEFCVGTETNTNNITLLDNLLTSINTSFNGNKKYKAILFGYNRERIYDKYSNNDNAYKTLGIIYNTKIHKHVLKYSLLYNLDSCLDTRKYNYSINNIDGYTSINSKRDIQNIKEKVINDSRRFNNITLIRRHNFIFNDTISKSDISSCIGQYAQVCVFYNKLYKNHLNKRIVISNVHYPKCNSKNDKNQVSYLKKLNNNIIRNNKYPHGVNIILGDVNQNSELIKDWCEPDNFNYIKMTNDLSHRKNNFGLYLKNDNDNKVKSISSMIIKPDRPYYGEDDNYSSHFFHSMKLII